MRHTDVFIALEWYTVHYCDIIYSFIPVDNVCYFQFFNSAKHLLVNILVLISYCIYTSFKKKPQKQMLDCRMHMSLALLDCAVVFISIITIYFPL